MKKVINLDKKFPITLLTALIIIGLTAAYVNTTGVSSFMLTIIDHYGLDPIHDQVFLNILDSIVFPLFIISSFLGTIIGRRFGLRFHFSLILLLTGVGILMTLLADKSIMLLLASRVVFGMGLGMNIPFSGMRVMAWYKADKRERMNALDPLQVYVGSIISFMVIPGIALVLGEGIMKDGFLFAIASPGFVVLACWLVLVLATRKSDIDPVNRRKEEADYFEPTVEKNMFANLLKRKDIVLLMIAVVCDLGVFVSLCSILTRWVQAVGGFSEYTADLWAGIALPLCSAIGVLVGTSIAIKSGKRKPVIVFCQFLKFAAIMTACFGGEHSVYLIIAGAMMYGIGNAAWMMPMTQLTMEQPDMNHLRFGGALTLIQASAGTAGIGVPIIQGILSRHLIMSSDLVGHAAQIAYGFKWSIFILGMLSIISIVTTLCLRETGKGRNNKEISVSEAANGMLS